MLQPMKKLRKLGAAVGLLALLLWAGPCLAGKGALTEVKLPAALAPGLHHLLSLVEAPQTAVFQPAEIAPVLAFVRATKPGATLYYSDNRTGLTSAFYQFEIACTLTHMLRYAYNSEVPGYLLMPSSIHYSAWSEVNGRPQPLPGSGRSRSPLVHPTWSGGPSRLKSPPTFSPAPITVPPTSHS